MFHVSRTPVREAIVRLVSDGLVVPRRGYGYVVFSMGAKEAEDLYVVREALETTAVRLAIELMTPEACGQLKTTIEALAPRSIGKRGTRSAVPGVLVHDLIVRSSGNRALYETWQRILQKILPYMWIETLYGDDVHRTLQEHRGLYRCIRDRDAKAAETLLRKHIRRAKENLVRVLQAQTGGRKTGTSDARQFVGASLGCDAREPVQPTGAMVRSLGLAALNGSDNKRAAILNRMRKVGTASKKQIAQPRRLP